MIVVQQAQHTGDGQGGTAHGYCVFAQPTALGGCVPLARRRKRWGMNMKTSRGDAAFVGVRELVCKLLGFYDKPTCDVITRFAKEDHANRHGLDAIPREFL